MLATSVRWAGGTPFPAHQRAPIAETSLMPLSLCKTSRCATHHFQPYGVQLRSESSQSVYDNIVDVRLLHAVTSLSELRINLK